jgi:Notch-like protein
MASTMSLIDLASMNFTSSTSQPLANVNNLFQLTNLTNQTQLLSILSTYTNDLSACLTNCSNKGTCMFNTQISKYVCLCQEFYNGTACQLDIRPCANLICLNSGQCVEDTLTSASCNCSLGFYGSQCQYEYNPCMNVTCSNRGYCFTNDTTTTSNKNTTSSTTKMTQCKCYADYEGEQCEIEKIFAKFVRYVTLSSLIIVLTCLAVTVLIIVGNDVWTCLIRKTAARSKNYKKKDSNYKVRFKYYNTSKE